MSLVPKTNVGYGYQSGGYNEAKAEVFDYIERFDNPFRRHATIGYLSPVEFERIGGLP